MSSHKSRQPSDSHTPSDRQAHFSVRPASLLTLLDAVERAPSLSRRGVTEATGLSPTTVKKATNDLVQTGILTLCDGYDAQSGRPCQLLVPTNTCILPILDMSEPRMEARLVDMHLHTVAAARLEYNHTIPPTDNLRLLCRRACVLTGSCSDRVLAAPILLLPDDMQSHPMPETEAGHPFVHPQRLSAAVADEAGADPLTVIHTGKAVSCGLRYLPISTAYRFLLYLRIGSVNRASLLVRERFTADREEWTEPTCGRILPTALDRYLADLRPHTAPWLQGIQHFLSEFCSFCIPDCIVIDRANGTFLTVDELLPHIPAEVDLLLPPNSPDIPTIAQLGAAHIGRRILWEQALR